MSLEVGALVWIRNNQSNSESTWIPSTVKAIVRNPLMSNKSDLI